jgi:hypothetical protein
VIVHNLPRLLAFHLAGALHGVRAAGALHGVRAARALHRGRHSGQPDTYTDPCRQMGPPPRPGVDDEEVAICRLYASAQLVVKSTCTWNKSCLGKEGMAR